MNIIDKLDIMDRFIVMLVFTGLFLVSLIQLNISRKTRAYIWALVLTILLGILFIIVLFFWVYGIISA